MTGSVKSLVLEKGFGFLKPDDGDEDVFFHANQLRGGLEFSERLREQYVTFDVIRNDRGLKAMNVMPARM